MGEQRDFDVVYLFDTSRGTVVGVPIYSIYESCRAHHVTVDAHPMLENTLGAKALNRHRSQANDNTLFEPILHDV